MLVFVWSVVSVLVSRNRLVIPFPMALEGPPDFSPAPGPLVTVDPPQLRQERESSEMVKLFVGQVPKHFDENDLRPYLESYGSIHELSVLRDRITYSHRGSAVPYAN